ncbi:MAG TPA: GDP-L-fucose synthase [Thermodesulfovibrionales bacterium]|nr:GDP-L-fucose synthase [Thermodesulfovibrionales bacterium]
MAGHRGLVGSAILRRLQFEGYENLVLRTSRELDLTRQSEVERFFEDERPEYVFLAAAKVGGILANNTYPAEFIYKNIAIESNVINSSYLTGAKKLLFLGSSCIYPRDCPQPMKEEYLLSGYLEKTNEPYAVAKIAGIKMCESYNRQYGTNYIAVMPTNLYGPGDDFDLQNSHVIPALIRKFHDGVVNLRESVEVWGTGRPFREFLHVDDLADACVFLMKSYTGSEIINIGTGIDLTIKDLAEMIRDIVDYRGAIVWDSSKPDGTPRKLLDISRISALGWQPKISLSDGLRDTYEWYSKYGNNRRM